MTVESRSHRRHRLPRVLDPKVDYAGPVGVERGGVDNRRSTGLCRLGNVVVSVAVYAVQGEEEAPLCGIPAVVDEGGDGRIR